jgi:DNA-directed RNA polymerase specialized sigma24 family protein
MTRDERNSLCEEKYHLIDVTVKKHSRLIRAARMDEDDVRQDLAVRMIQALDKYDPARCSNMDAYLILQLRYCLLHMKECGRLFGMPYAPRKGFVVSSLNTPKADREAQAQSYDETSRNIIWLENEIAGLPDPQRAVIDRLLSGGRVNGRNKYLQAARETIRGRAEHFSLMYA